MSKTVHVILYLLALFCFAIAAFTIGNERFAKVGWIALGLGFWVLNPLGDLIF